MKYNTLIWYVIGALLFVSVVSAFFYYKYIDEIKKTKKKKANKIASLTLLFALFLSFWKSNIPAFDGYNLSREYDRWAQNNIPVISKGMILNSLRFTYGRAYYINHSEDSIRHHYKEIEYDFRSVYRERDKFYNKINDQSLESVYIYPSLIRDSSRTYLWSKNDTTELIVSKARFDSILYSWGLYESAFPKSKPAHLRLR